uniref:site-specific integrase n=1 Tax=Marinobacterium jannaschii TaxID=64970 RepID=UPI001471D4D1|nr:site-specific integrase [Marinobacterium jannaschii]
MSSPFIQALRDHMRARHYSKRTEKTYIYWTIFYIRFNNLSHPNDLSSRDIVRFLEYLVVERNVTASTQKTALNALIYLHRQFLGWDEAQLQLGAFRRASKPKNSPLYCPVMKSKQYFAIYRESTCYAHT